MVGYVGRFAAEREQGLLGPLRGEELLACVRNMVDQPLLRRRRSLTARHGLTGRSWTVVDARWTRHYREVIAERHRTALDRRAG